MNVVIWMVAGGVVGWVACTMLHLNVGRGLVVSAIIGIAGAFFGGHVLAPIFGAQVGEAGAFSPFALLVAAATAAGCLTVSDMMYERFGV
jgi:uncharacterized membrane protein YeaQ/YmgE (transglycosylase-associated protein family)